MSNTTPEIPRVLTVDQSQRWLEALNKRLEAIGIEYAQTKEVDEAIKQLNSGDFTAVIIGGLKGGWRAMVEETDRLGIQPVVLSASTVAVHEAQAQGVASFHKNRPLTKEGVDPIIQAAINPEAVSQQ